MFLRSPCQCMQHWAYKPPLSGGALTDCPHRIDARIACSTRPSPGNLAHFHYSSTEAIFCSISLSHHSGPLQVLGLSKQRQPKFYKSSANHRMHKLSSLVVVFFFSPRSSSTFTFTTIQQRLKEFDHVFVLVGGHSMMERNRVHMS